MDADHGGATEIASLRERFFTIGLRLKFCFDVIHRKKDTKDQGSLSTGSWTGLASPPVRKGGLKVCTFGAVQLERDFTNPV